MSERLPEEPQFYMHKWYFTVESFRHLRRMVSASKKIQNYGSCIVRFCRSLARNSNCKPFSIMLWNYVIICVKVNQRNFLLFSVLRHTLHFVKCLLGFCPIKPGMLLSETSYYYFIYIWFQVNLVSSLIPGMFVVIDQVHSMLVSSDIHIVWHNTLLLWLDENKSFVFSFSWVVL